MIEQSDIVYIDNDESELAVVNKLIPDTDLVILHKFGGNPANRTFVSVTRLTVVKNPYHLKGVLP